MDKHLVASVYEMRGERGKAIAIYRDILRENPMDKKAEASLRIIVDSHKIAKIVAKNINIDMLNYFKKSRTAKELYELERWLIGN